MYVFGIDCDGKEVIFTVGKITEEVTLTRQVARGLLVKLRECMKAIIRYMMPGDVTAEVFEREKVKVRAYYDNRDGLVHIRMNDSDRLVFKTLELFGYFLMKLQQSCDAADLTADEGLLLVSQDGVIKKTIDVKSGDTTVVRP